MKTPFLFGQADCIFLKPERRGKEDKSIMKHPCIFEKLNEYAATDYYPFHMPGHKRRLDLGIAVHFPNPYCIDITEIEGFDNLHHAEGIIRDSMEWAASVYGADKTYYLINGSSSGILSAISGITCGNGTILMSRNCHKSAYHGVILNRLKSRYVYPQFVEEYGLQCGLDPKEIQNMLKDFDDISAVLVVSPTYDGIISDIKEIAQICHKNKVPLIVDEAHGAHFRYSELFPTSALESGADVVIQSVHKTLPCFTQSALIHLKKGYVESERIEQYLQIYQSSSPSYLLMVGIEQGIKWMESKEGRKTINEFTERLMKLRQVLGSMKQLKLVGKEMIGKGNIYDMDCSKILVSTKGTEINGLELCNKLREEYHLEMEMCTADYVTAITSVMDTEEGINRLKEALLEIDGELAKKKKQAFFENQKKLTGKKWDMEAEQAVTLYEGWSGKKKSVLLEQSAGQIAAEFVYLYPPGIPIIAPGERIRECIINRIIMYRTMGLPVQGMRDFNHRMIQVLERGI